MIEVINPPFCQTAVIGSLSFFNTDNIELMKTFADKQFDLAIVDPPYGLGKRTTDGGIKHPLDIDNPLPYVTFEKSEQEVMDEFKAVINTVYPPEGDTHKVVETGKGRRLYSKCNRGDVIRSYVEESNLNKGEYVLVIQCRNGRKFIVAGNHHAPTYLKPYDQSSDIKEANNEKK